MGIDYTPSFVNYSGQGKFRFWCQSVLPLVYDDSLSYMELLNKMVIYLNNTIQDVAAVETNVDALLAAYNQLQKYVNDYFDNLDVQNEINVKLDGLVEDGTMSELIQPFIDAGLPGLVETNLPGVVENQIPGVVSEQLDDVVEDQIGAVVAEQIPSQVTGWLNDNVTPVGSAVIVDKTLTIEGAAADAKATGDAINEVESGISELNNTVKSLFVEGSVTAENEIILTTSPFISEAEITGTNACTVRNAQIFEAVYPGITQYGVQITKNDDGSYTINGVATSGAVFHLNKSTRTGTDNPFALPNGKYSITAEIISGTIEKNESTSNSLLYIGVFDSGITSIATSPLRKVIISGEEYTPSNTVDEFETTNTIIGIRLTTGVRYNNARIRIMVNKGEPLNWVKYKTPVSMESPFNDLASIINNYNPLAWISAENGFIALTTGESPKEYTDAKIDELKEYVDDEISNIPIADRFRILEKNNDRVDALAQLFTKNLLLLLYTDIHGNAVNLNRINTWKANNKPVYVKDVYCLGDMVDDQATDSIAELEGVPIWAPTLKIIGNHDVLSGGTIPGITQLECYNKYIKPYVSQWNVVQPENAESEGKSYYYKDYNNLIRVIVLDTYYYTVAQNTWFVETLENARTNNLSVIVAEHEDMCTPTEKQPLNSDYPFARKHGGYTGLQYRTYGDGGNYQTKRNAVDAFIANGGTFLCWLSGHMHTDMTGYYQGEHGKQLSIVLSNASNSQTSSVRINNYCQDCFTYLAVDTDAKYLYLLRIGIDIDRWYHKNRFLCYDYDNHSVVEYR